MSLLTLTEMSLVNLLNSYVLISFHYLYFVYIYLAFILICCSSLAIFILCIIFLICQYCIVLLELTNKYIIIISGWWGWMIGYLLTCCSCLYGIDHDYNVSGFVEGLW